MISRIFLMSLAALTMLLLVPLDSISQSPSEVVRTLTQWPLAPTLTNSTALQFTALYSHLS